MNLTIIQKSIDYIEDNLKTDITAKELSEMAGFSMFHYYRLFQSAVGLPVMQYITRRRQQRFSALASLRGKELKTENICLNAWKMKKPATTSI